MTPNPDPVTAWQVILTLGVLFAIGANVVVILRQSQIQKREVRFNIEPASKEAFDRHVEFNAGEHRDIFSKIGGVDRGSSQKISNEVTAVHNRVNSLEKSVGGLETSAHLTHQRLASMDRKMDDLPAQIIATLKNTGAIGREL